MALTKIKLDTMVTGNLPDANIPNNITISNAGTATALETARTIHGVSFDGTANIDLTEAIQDVVGGMVSSNTETNIAVTYDDTNGKLDFVSTDTNTFRPITAGGNSLGSSETLAFTAGSNVTITESGGAVTIASTDTNTTYSVGDGGLTQNNFTNTLKSKLDGIETGATADQDLSGYATLSGATFTGNIRTSTGTDYAQLLGRQGGLEVRSSRSTDAGIGMAGSDGSFRFQLYGNSSGTEYGFLDSFWGNWDFKKNVNGAGYLRISGTNREIIHAGNIGSQSVSSASSATNADTVDSLHASSFIRLDTSSTQNQSTQTKLKAHSNAWAGGLALLSQDGNQTFQIHPDNNGYMYVDKNWYFTGNVAIGATNTYAWHSGNDGSGSGLDADVLDGYHGSNYIGKNGNTYYKPNTWIDMVDGGNAGIYWSGGTGSGHHIYPKNQTSMYHRSGDSSSIALLLNTNGTDRGYVYANNANEIGFLDENGSWALKKKSGGSLILYDDGGQTDLGSGDEWGRLMFEGYGNGTYIYSSGTFRVDGGHWCTYDDNELDLGGNQTTQRWRNLYLGQQIVGGFGALSTGGTANWNDSSNARSGAGYTLLLGNASNGPSGTGNYFHSHSYEYNSKTGAGNICQFAIPYIVGAGGGMYMRSRYDSGWGGWVKFYDSDNMGYLTNSSNTYGTFNVQGGGNSWSGITYSTHSSKPTIMFKHNHGDGGLYHQGSSSWRWYYDQNNTCLGLNGSTTNSSYGAYVSGSMYVTGSYGSSDIRFKENIETIDNGLDKVMKMRGVYFDWNDEHKEEKGDSRQVGVIAQEIRTVLPEVVMHQDNDEYAVDYSKITAVLIESIKELKNEINQLKEGCCHGS